jgi:formate hydrogenlyase transcriptional activator
MATVARPGDLLNFADAAPKSKTQNIAYTVGSDVFSNIIGHSTALQSVLRKVEVVAATDATVLLLGETGTGKDCIAKAIHGLSPRRKNALVRTDCASIPAGLLESELFGHEKGAYTGAVTQNIGRFELAHRGTLFLDEVGDIPLELQSKLLRVLQEQEIERVGSTRTMHVDFRLVAATNHNLTRMVAEGRFRNDLFYRLNIFVIQIPALRERREDIASLVWHFTRRFAHRLNKQINVIRPEDMNSLVDYSWPGNVRELQNTIERSVILSTDMTLRHPSLPTRNPEVSTKIRTLADAERAHILKALHETDWVIGGRDGAASQLDVKRTTLLDKMRRLGISRAEHRASRTIDS